MSRAQKYGYFMIVAATALLVGCSSDDDGGDGDGGGGGTGSGGSPSGNNDLPNPCSLLAASDIETLTGESSLTGERNGDRCDWFTRDQDAIANVTIYPSASTYDAGKRARSEGPISGLGADAFLGTNHDVNVKMASGRWFMAQCGLPPVDGMVSTEIETAGASLNDADKKRSEASYRLAKIVAQNL